MTLPQVQSLTVAARHRLLVPEALCNPVRIGRLHWDYAQGLGAGAGNRNAMKIKVFMEVP